MASIVRNICKFLSRLEATILDGIGSRFPPEHFGLAIAGIENSKPVATKTSFIDDWLKDSVLWAVPKTKRPKNKVRNRKFGWPQYVWKPIVDHTNIIMCRDCGNPKEAGRLCKTCYTKVKLVTEDMQEAIQKELGLEPCTREVVVLYEGEEDLKNEEYYKGKRIVEIPTPRPPIFCKNLLQKTTQAPATTSEIQTNQLG